MIVRSQPRTVVVPGPPVGSPGVPGTPGLANNAFATRSAMAAYAPGGGLHVGDNFFLSEAGREGWFKVDLASSWTAPIAADTSQGALVASTFDATKVFVRVDHDEIIATAAGATFNNSTDDHLAVIGVTTSIRALTGNRAGGMFYGGGPRMKLPAGKTGYMGTTTIEIDWTGQLGGHGAGRWGPGGRGASALRWAGGAVGIIVQHPDTTGTIGVSGSTHNGSGGFGFEHFMMQGPEDGVEVSDANLFLTDIAIVGRMPITGRDLYIRGWRGIGILSLAGTYDGTFYSGNTSLTDYSGTKVEGGRIAVFSAGGDANIQNYDNFEAYQNTQCGLYFDVGIGPISGKGIHTASNGMITGYLSYMCHYLGIRFAAVPNTPTATLRANAPPSSFTSNAYWTPVETGGPDSVVKTWDGSTDFRWGGDVVTQGKVNPNQVAFFPCLYSENPGVVFLGASTLIMSSVIARKYRVGGVHVYALNNIWHCDESVDIGGNVTARGFNHTLGDDTAAATNFVLNLDTSNTEVLVNARGAGGVPFAQIAFEKNFANLYTAPSNSGHMFAVGAPGSATYVIEIDGNGLYPVTNNVVSCGKAGNRFTEFFATNGVINTSDERHKTSIAAPGDELLDAWAEVEWSAYQMTEAVKAKGKDGARIHVGIIAQRVQAVLAKHEIDGFRYGLLCFDKWDDEYEPVFETKTIEEEYRVAVAPKHEGMEWKRADKHKDAKKRRGKPGKWRRVHKLSEEQRLGFRFEKRTVDVQAPVLDTKGERVMKLSREAGELFGVRYEEALSLEAALQRRERQRLEERVAKIEKLLAA
jgi:hypothetical protein